MSGVRIDFGAQRTPEGPRPWWRVTTTPSVTKVYLTEDLDAVETAIENHRNAMDHLWTKMRKPESERDKDEPHQPRFGHPSQYAWLMARAYQEEHGARIGLASEKHTALDFHKPEVLLADAKSIVDDQGFGYTLSWNHGIRNDTVPTSKAAADTLNEQRTQAKLLHHYFVGEYRKLTQASRESLFPNSGASRAQIMSSLDALLSKARMDMSTVLQAGPAPDASVPGLSPARWEEHRDSQAVDLAGMNQPEEPGTSAYAGDLDIDDGEDDEHEQDEYVDSDEDLLRIPPMSALPNALPMPSIKNVIQHVESRPHHLWPVITPRGRDFEQYDDYLPPRTALSDTPLAIGTGRPRSVASLNLDPPVTTDQQAQRDASSEGPAKRATSERGDPSSPWGSPLDVQALRQSFIATPVGSLGTAYPPLGSSAKRAGKLPALVEDPNGGVKPHTEENVCREATGPPRPGPRKGLNWARVARSNSESALGVSSASGSQQKHTRWAARGAASGTGSSERASRRSYGKLKQTRHSRSNPNKAESTGDRGGSVGGSQQTGGQGIERALDQPWRDLRVQPLQRLSSGIVDPSKSKLAVRGRQLGQETVDHSTNTADPSLEAGGIQTWEPSLEGEDQDDSELET